MWWRLGTLVSGLSPTEVTAANTPVGLHGIYAHPLYLPLELVRSMVFFAKPDHGAFLTRLPNTLFGIAAIWAVWRTLNIWHGPRTAAFATALFATSAWTLHTSRLASFDVLYLCAAPLLLLCYLELQKRPTSALVWYGTALVWGLCLYIPGLVWLVALSAFRQRKAIATGWRHFAKTWQRALYLLANIIWWPLLLHDIIKHTDHLKAWAGLPNHFAAPATVLKQLVLVPVHLFVRGPKDAERWLGQLPLFDIFTLVVCLLGVYFYLRHWQASRTRLLGSFLVVSGVLVGLGGPVSLSFLVPILYMISATGIAYLLHNWLRSFPVNPIARGVGIGLISAAVAFSCIYNLRAYFVAWPHNHVTEATFRADP